MSGPNMGKTAFGIYTSSSSACLMANVEMLEISKGRCVGCMTIFHVHWLRFLQLL